MSALTLRLPDDKHARLKSLARRRRTSVNRLMEEMATVMIAEADAETRFALRASRGQGEEARGLALLRKAASPKGRFS
jgi:predicted transcriptional regulator